MPTTATDLEQRLEDAIAHWQALDDAALAANGHEAQQAADAAASEAFAEMQRLHEAWSRTGAGEQMLANLRAARNSGDSNRLSTTQVLSDGRTFDDLASQSGVVNPAPGMTLGEAFTQSQAYQEFVGQFRKSDGSIAEKFGKSHTVDFAVSFAQMLNDRQRYGFRDGDGPKNTLVTGNSDSQAGALIQTLRIPGLSDLAPIRQPRVLELCTRVPLDTDLFEFEQILTKTNNAATVPEATSSAFIDGTTVTAVMGGRKPESGLTFGVKSVKIENIAHFIPVTRRAAADAPRLTQILNTFLFQGLAVKAEDQAMSGNGTSPNWQGLLNTTTPWNISTFDISANGSPTRLDAIALAAGSVYSAGEGEWAPNAVLIHPLDWFSTNFLLAKDSQGQYYGPGPWAALGAQAPWGIQPVITKAVTQGVQVLGDFSQMLFGDRQQNTLYATDSNQDWFERNLLAFLAEMRGAVGVRVPGVFVQIVA